jgi:hypothetical protein
MFFTTACFVASTICCTVMVLSVVQWWHCLLYSYGTVSCTVMALSVVQQLLDRWHFFDDLKMQKCSLQGLYGCCHCIQIILGKLMTCLDTLSAILVELQGVSVFVEGFLVPQPRSPNWPMVTDVSLQGGDWVETFCLNHYLSPPFFYQFISRNPSIVCLDQQQLIFVFSCWLLFYARLTFHFLVVTCIFSSQIRITYFSFIWICE